jgi:hypothetical protein
MVAETEVGQVGARAAVSRVVVTSREVRKVPFDVVLRQVTVT